MRIKQLETETGQQLLRRSRGGIILTPAGERLLEYIRLREIIDIELHRTLAGTDEDAFLSGVIRIAGHFSAIMHIAVPSLAGLMRENPDIQLETLVREHTETSLLLERGSSDLALIPEPLAGDSYETHFLGYEKYILVKSKKFKTRSDTFLDSHPLDKTTEDFLRLQSSRRQRAGIKRSFLHNEVGILRAVELGLGVAVVAAREIRRDSLVSPVPGYTPLMIPCYLQASRYARRSRLLSAAIDTMVTKSVPFLKPRLENG